MNNQTTDNEHFNQPNSKPWRVTRHEHGLIKVESKDRVIFDGFQGEDGNAMLAAAAPQLRAALLRLMNEFRYLKPLVLAEQFRPDALTQAREAINDAGDSLVGLSTTKSMVGSVIEK